MSSAFDSRLGKQLYQLLPEVYRTRDKKVEQTGGGSGTEDLARYLDAHGHLLDLIHATLEQQLRDALPASSQDWLLPYFAQLLAANIVSPDAEGKHAEIAHAVSWRQRKGTLKCVEEIAKAVGQMEVEIQEGWKRVAMTPRIGMPLIPAKAWDDMLKNIDKVSPPSEAARHPGLPAAMVDLRRPSRAVNSEPTNPAARISSFAGVKKIWRQANRHCAPCFPGSFDDVSRRTVDIRTPDATNGHHHHKRLLAYAPPPVGLFPYNPLITTWDKALQENFIEEKHESDVLVYSNRTDRIIEITQKVPLEKKQYRIEGINFHGELEIPDGGKLVLIRSAAKSLTVNTALPEDRNDVVIPVLDAKDCLFDELTVENGLARLEYCTVMGAANCMQLQASDCIFIGNITVDAGNSPKSGCIRYSRIPEDFDGSALNVRTGHTDTNTRAIPLFNELSYCVGNTIRALAIDSNDPAIIYAGTLGHGVFKSVDDGLNWTEMNAGLSDPNVQSLAIDPNDSAIIYAGTHGHGVFKSVDGGLYWATMNTDLSDLNVQALAIDPAGTLYAGSHSHGVFKRDDGELYWADMNTDLSDLNVQVLAIDPNNSDVIYAGTNGRGVFKSENGGLYWVEMNTGLSKLNIQALAIKPNDSDIIYAGTNSDGVLKSLDAGLHWAKINTGLTDLNVQALAIDPNDPAIIYAGTHGGGVFRSDDGGLNWAQKIAAIGPKKFDHRCARFGEPGYGVLNPLTSNAIRFGAEDGGEMGAYHHKYYSLKAEVVLDKVREFLPIGIEPVLIFDTRLLHEPPEI